MRVTGQLVDVDALDDEDALRGGLVGEPLVEARAEDGERVVGFLAPRLRAEADGEAGVLGEEVDALLRDGALDGAGLQAVLPPAGEDLVELVAPEDAAGEVLRP